MTIGYLVMFLRTPIRFISIILADISDFVSQNITHRSATLVLDIVT